jgi:hypothetical protein
VLIAVASDNHGRAQRRQERRLLTGILVSERDQFSEEDVVLDEILLHHPGTVAAPALRVVEHVESLVLKLGGNVVGTWDLELNNHVFVSGGS